MRSELLGRIRTLGCRLRGSPAFRTRVLALVVLVLAAVLLARGLRQGGALGGGRSNDFAAYHAAARAVLAGDLAASYRGERPYQYPPALAVLIAPLSLLPHRVAAALWTLGSLVLLLWAFRALDQALGPKLTGLDKLLGLLLTFRMAESDFANGNANTLVLVLLVAGFALARTGGAGAGGALIGLAASLKATPAVLLLWMLARRRWRMASGFLAGVAVFAVAFPALVLGPAPFASAWRGFYGSTLRPLDAAGDGYRDEAPGGYLPGQSLRAFLHRLLRETDATAHDERNVGVNLADLPKGAVDALYLALAAVVLGALLLAFRGRCKAWSAAEIAAALASMVLIAPLSRKAHFVVLLPAAAAAHALLRELPPRRRRLCRGLWWAAFGLCVLTAPALIGRPAATLALAFCPLGIAAGLLALIGAAGRGALEAREGDG